MKKISLVLLIIFAFTILFAQSADVTATINPSTVAPGGKAIVEVTYSYPKDMHQTLQEDFFYFAVTSPEGVEIGKIEYPKGKEHDGVIDYYEPTTLKAEVTFPSNLSKDIEEINVEANFQICFDSGSCMAPDYKDIKLPVIVSGEAAPVAATTAKTETTKTPLMEMLKFLLFAFLGGVILNIMPCVLPVLSIKAMSLVKQSQQDRKQILVSSFAYTAGILVSFLVLAIVIIVLKSAGEMAGWGFQFQNPGFVLTLLIMLFVFALSLFDVFVFSAPGMSAATKASSKSGVGGAFLSGIFAVLLATPCTAPLLGAAIGFALKQSPPMIIIFFLLIGTGLALPFILLGIWPKAIKMIPKPGEWMNVFKEFMGFLLFGTAIFLLNTVYKLIGGPNTIGVLWYLLILSLASWIYGRWTRPHIPKMKQYIATIIVIALAIGGYKGLVNLNPPPASEVAGESHNGWEVFSPELIQQYRDSGTPVFLDFGASWCMTCNTNERTVLYTDDIREEFEKYGVKTVRGDYTRKDPVIGEWLRKYERAGVPLYLLFVPGQDNAEMLPEIITKSMVKNLLKEKLGS